MFNSLVNRELSIVRSPQPQLLSCLPAHPMGWCFQNPFKFTVTPTLDPAQALPWVLLDTEFSPQLVHPTAKPPFSQLGLHGEGCTSWCRCREVARALLSISSSFKAMYSRLSASSRLFSSRLNCNVSRVRQPLGRALLSTTFSPLLLGLSLRFHAFFSLDLSPTAKSLLLCRLSIIFW